MSKSHKKQGNNGDLLAAGTICWRRIYDDHGDPRTLILLIHRTKQQDVSFPKGKLDPGESMPEAAVRETFEETGLRINLGMNLGTIQYDLGENRTKTVQYWAAKVTSKIAIASRFMPNGEIQALEWVPIDEVRKRLSYKADKELFDVFLRLASHDLLDTFSVTLLRHGKAEPRGTKFAQDHLRTLTSAGQDQAELLPALLTSFGPRRIYSSTAERCMLTVAPLAKHLDKRVRSKKSLSQDNWDAGDLSSLRKLVGKVVSRGKSVVLCSHRPVLPSIARELVLATGTVPGTYLEEATSLPPGGFSVFHFSRKRPGAGILSVETYPVKA